MNAMNIIMLIFAMVLVLVSMIFPGVDGLTYMMWVALIASWCVLGASLAKKSVNQGESTSA